MLRIHASNAVAVVALTLSIGCGGASATSLQTSAPAAGAESDVAPYPYTVAEIRSSCHERVIEFRMEKAGAAPTRERWEFHDIDADTVNITTTNLDGEGKPIGTPVTEPAKWAELHEHARFPRASTTVQEEAITVPAGAFQATRYQVMKGDTVKTLWFARGLAGPPVRLIVTKAGQPLMEMTMLTSRSR